MFKANTKAHYKIAFKKTVERALRKIIKQSIIKKQIRLFHLFTLMYKFIIVLIVISGLLTACDPPPQQNNKTNNLMLFKASELIYFNNVRRVAYEVLQLNGPLKIYRHKEIDENAFLKPAIVINQNADEAYLLIDYPMPAPGSKIKINDETEIQLSDHESHFKAFQLLHLAAKEDKHYKPENPNSIQNHNNNELKITFNGNHGSLNKKEIQNAWAYMLADYYRLTGKPLK